MKNKLFFYVLLLLISCVNAFGTEKNKTNWLLGISNKYFIENNKEADYHKNLYSIVPFIGYSISKDFSFEVEFEYFEYNRITDYSRIYDASPFINYIEKKIFHIPLSVKYHYSNGKKLSPYIKAIGIFRNEKREVLNYYFNQSPFKQEKKDVSFMFGIGLGATLEVSENSEISLGGFYCKVKGERINNIGLNLTLTYKL